MNERARYKTECLKDGFSHKTAFFNYLHSSAMFIVSKRDD